jgi:hypothetical protein
MPEPMHVYPNPDGGANSSNYVPSDTRLAAGSIAAGAVAVGAAATGSGTAFLTNAFLVLQSATSGHEQVAASVLGVHAADAKHVAVFLFFSSLSVLLATINLVIGLRMKERLRGLSNKVCQVCKTAGLIS